MAIHADFISKETVKNAIVKLDSIWGSKQNGWSAWVHIFDREDFDTPISVFSVNTPYIEDQNPYEALYGEISKLAFLNNVTHDHLPEIIIPVILNVEPKTLFEQLDEKPKARKGTLRKSK